MHESTNNFPVYGVLGNTIAPVLLAQDREMLPPSHRTGRQLYTMSFWHTEFPET